MPVPLRGPPTDCELRSLGFEEGKFQNYWSTTAMTTFLTDALKKESLDFSTIDIDQAALEAYEPENPRLVTLLYQTGYLTIRSFRQTGTVRRYDLCFPNLEVENSFLTSLAPVYAGIDATRSTNYQFAAADALVAGDAEKFVKVLKNFFANTSIPMPWTSPECAGAASPPSCASASAAARPPGSMSILNPLCSPSLRCATRSGWTP